jgi:hypothetical protein
MSKIIIAPSKYVQGKGELARIKEHTKDLGKALFIIASSNGIKRVKATI